MSISSRSLLLPVTLLVASFLLVPINSFAASMKVYKGTHALFLEGEIEKGDFENFMNGIRKHELLPSSVSISSPGGDVETAMKFGRFFRRAAIVVRVQKDGQCDSACFLILVGATERIFGAKVGIHRPYYDREVYSALSPSDAAKYFQTMNHRVRGYLLEMDVPTELIDRMMSIESSEMQYLSPREIEDAIDTFAPSHEEWLLARCGISLSDESGSGSAPDSLVTDEQVECWNDSLDAYQNQVLTEILGQ